MKKLFIAAVLLAAQAQAAVLINGKKVSNYAISPNEIVTVSDNKNTSQPRKRLLLNSQGCVIQNNTDNTFLLELPGTYSLVGYDGFGGILISTFTITTKPLPAPIAGGFAGYCLHNTDSFVMQASTPLAMITWYVDGAQVVNTNTNDNWYWSTVEGSFYYTAIASNGVLFTSAATTKVCTPINNTDGDKWLKITLPEVEELSGGCTIYDYTGRMVEAMQVGGIYVLICGNAVNKIMVK